MFHFRTVIFMGLLASSLGLSVGSMAQSTPTTSVLTTRLSGASEVPTTASSGSGSVDAMLNRQTNELNWTITYSGLSGPATAAHFHGPAMPGENAGVVVPIPIGLDHPVKGAATLTAAQAAELLSGKWYVNVHTAANPHGEIRGQVNVRP